MLSKPPASHPLILSTRRGFGLALLTRTKNPSQLARALYLAPPLAPHAMLSGSTAEEIGEQSLGIELVDPSYFFTEHRWREHRRALGLPEEPLPPGHIPSKPAPAETFDQMPTGTVGAVALDMRGCIAAVTSTGGRTNKLVGRIGDTPQMGSGFWAEEWNIDGWFRKTWRKACGKGDKQAVGVSGTGDGDVCGNDVVFKLLIWIQYFIRLATASTVARRVKLLHEPLKKAAQQAVDDLRKGGGLGGVIAVDRKGNGETEFLL